MPKKKEPFYIFLQTDNSQREFKVLSEQEICLLQPNVLIVVFEAVVHVSKEEALECLQKYDFGDMVLFQAAQAPPYEPKSNFKDIKEPDAVAEIAAYREREAEIRNFFTLDHIYLNRLDAELKKDKL